MILALVLLAAVLAAAVIRPHGLPEAAVAVPAALVAPSSRVWRQVLACRSRAPALREFTLLGLLAVPPALAAAVTTLWAVLSISS